MKNSVLFLTDDHALYSLMSSNLQHFTTIFGWQKNISLKAIMEQYILPPENFPITNQLYHKLLQTLKLEINKCLKMPSPTVMSQVALEKLLEYYHITKHVLMANDQGMMGVLKGLTLHQHFGNLAANSERINDLLAILEL
jgi:hypothetical protein